MFDDRPWAVIFLHARCASGVIAKGGDVRSSSEDEFAGANEDGNRKCVCETYSDKIPHFSFVRSSQLGLQ